MRTALPFVCLLVVLVNSAAGDEPALQRWAVVATEPVVESGVLDLLTVALSKDESIHVVERERLQEAMRELEVTALLKPGNVSQRLQLGKTLRANALMVIDFERTNGKRMLRVVVSDATLGVRLWRESFVGDAADIDGLIEQCVALVGEVRQRFAGGIQQIIAVPPFLSEDFGQRFDFLQTRFSDSLSIALMTHAGVAVVEIEEAQAILRERQVTLSPGLERSIATIVNGKYRVGPLNELNQRTVKLEIKLVAGGKQREQIRKSIRLGSVGQWLAGDLAKRLLNDSDPKKPSVSPRTQKAVLTRLAQSFAEIGTWQRSTSLREAALVLDPNDALQRGLLISEYQHSVYRDVDYVWLKDRIPLEQAEHRHERNAHDFCVALEHLEYLVRNRLITRADAVGLFQTQVWQRRNGDPWGAPEVREFFAALSPGFVTQRRFIRDVFPLIVQLPTGRALPEHFSKPLYRWHYSAVRQTLSDVYFHNYSAASLRGLEDVLEQILPDTAHVSASILGLLNSHYTPKTGEANHAAWLACLRRLEASDYELARLYGLWGLLQDAQRRGEVLPAGMKSHLAALDSLLASLKKQGLVNESNQKYLEQNIAMRLNRLRVAANPPRPGQSPAPRLVATESLGRMRFDPIALVVDGQQNPGQPPLIKGMLQCGEECDAYRTKEQFFIMERPGELRDLKLSVHESKYGLFSEVTWDGECIWLHARGLGVIAIRPDGTRLATFKQSEHVPNYGKGLKLPGLSPRRALIVGSFGENHRGWCGILQIGEQGEQSANVFFEARYVPQGRTREESEADAMTAFRPAWIHHVNMPEGKRHVLVGRRELKGALQIDLDTFNVSVSGYDTHRFGRQGFFSHDGHLLASLGGNSLVHFSPPDSDGKVSTRRLAQIRPYVDQLLFHDGWVYVPGRVWRRLDPNERKPERLQARPSRLPVPYWSLKAGVSAHYGLIAYDLYKRSPPLFQITILDDESTKESGDAIRRTDPSR